MPSTSPGTATTSPSPFAQILPGAPSQSLQSVISFSFRHKRYVAYISGSQLNILSCPHALLQCVFFDENLVAVAAERRSGRLAVAAKKSAWILGPVTEGWRKVSWEKSLSLQWDSAKSEARTLSWGIEDEVLLGGNNQLSLFSTLPSSRADAALSRGTDGVLEKRRPLWSIRLSSPVQHATFNPSATVIATCGVHDRLVKIWRRLSFEEGLFDYMYIPHPSTVTFLQWRPPYESTEIDDPDDDMLVKKQEDDPELLYTIAADGVLRVWRTGTVHDLDILCLHTSIDLVPTVPDSPSLTFGEATSPSRSRPGRYTCLIPSEQFSSAVNTIIGVQDVKKDKHSSEHFREVVSKNPDVVISFDGRGRMSAWGLQSIGHKRRPESPPHTPVPAFHIAHAENLQIRIPESVNASFEAWLEGSVFNLVGHYFNGEVRWWTGDSASLFSLSSSADTQLSEVAYWSGHTDGPINTLAASSNCRSLLSLNAAGEFVLLESTASGVLERSSSAFRSGNNVLDAALIASTNNNTHYCLSLQDETSQATSGVNLVLQEFANSKIKMQKQALKGPYNAPQLQLFLSNGKESTKERAVVLSPDGRGFSCIVSTSTLSLDSPSNFTLLPYNSDDPLLHSTAVIDSRDLNRFGVIALTKSGSIVLHHIQTSTDTTLESALIAEFHSGVPDAVRLASNNDFAFVVPAAGYEVVVVNLTDGYVEHRLQSERKIRQIVPSPDSGLVAVASDSMIDVFAQGRIGYREEMPPWVQIKRISISGLGLMINAFTWLCDGGLAVAADSCVFISSNYVDVDGIDRDVREATGVESDSPQTMRMSTVAERLRRPIPAWHPTFIAHIVRFGQWSLAASLIGRLLNKLTFWSEGEHLQPLLNIPAAQLYGAEGIRDAKVLDRDTVADLTQQLKSKDLPHVSQSEQRRLLCVLEAMMFCSEHVNGLDNLALRYLYSWKFELLLMEAKHPGHGVQVNGSSTVPEMHWREVAFAFHSTTQQPLLEVLIAHYDNKITWNIARRLGLFAWLSDREALDQIFESLAQTAYRSSSPPDPINASLYFLALHKKQTLLGLWRIATWHKEQRATMNFLRRDFSQADSQTAAKKNAYALMGKRRFEYAAAFFLLADDGASAVSVLAGQCGDIMLAIAVGRLYSGDTSQAIRKLLQDRLIPQAKQNNDRWLLNWSYSLLSEQDAACSILVKPLGGVRGWHQDDPALLNLYSRLRTSESEYEFDVVLRAARILRRMGLWLTALELVSQWQFKHTETSPVKTASSKAATIPNGVESHAPSMLDDFMDAPPALHTKTADGESAGNDKAAREAKAAELLKQIKAKKDQTAVPTLNEKRAEPTQFKEPDANSLLDSFGF